MQEVRFTIQGVPRTKKNSTWRTKQGHQMPSLAYKQWETAALIQLGRAGHLGIKFAKPMNCKAIFYREAFRGDAVGYYQALADALEKAQVVVNDKWIVSWDGSRLEKDADNPRVDFELTEA